MVLSNATSSGVHSNKFKLYSDAAVEMNSSNDGKGEGTGMYRDGIWGSGFETMGLEKLVGCDWDC
jgi:hypothetical protein